MKVIPFIGVKTVELVPRYFPTDVFSLNIEVREEISNKVYNPTYDVDVTVNTLILTLTDGVVFKEKSKYVLTVKDEGDIVYIGKLVCLADNSKESIQDFKTTSVVNNKIRI